MRTNKMVGKQPVILKIENNKQGAKEMTGRYFRKSWTLKSSFMLSAGLVLAACDEGGLPFGNDNSAAPAISAATPIQTQTTDTDIERPDIFEVNDRGIWDGRPSLGGAWVAHPDVDAPERALIRNNETGQTIIGALFRRERDNPGPLLQISSDVASELGILPGAPTELYVVALRRPDVEIEEPEEAVLGDNPVVADLDTPVNVETTSLDPIAGAAAAIDAAEGAASGVVEGAATGAGAAAATIAAGAIPDGDGTDIVEVDLPPVETAALAAIDLPADTTGPQFQIGVFSVETNANNAAIQLRNAAVPTSVIAQEVGGRTVWSVISSPVDNDADATLASIKEAGFVDAVLIEADS